MKMLRFEEWLDEVRSALADINMPLTEWQAAFPYDFASDYNAGICAKDSARCANTFWWKRQDEALPIFKDRDAHG